MIPKVEDGNNFGVSIQEVKNEKNIKVNYFSSIGFISRSSYIRNGCNTIS
jgi:hypothetical protein